MRLIFGGGVGEELITRKKVALLIKILFEPLAFLSFKTSYKVEFVSIQATGEGFIFGGGYNLLYFFVYRYMVL